MENVARLYNHNKGQTRKEIIADFENLGYKVMTENYANRFFFENECQELDLYRKILKNLIWKRKNHSLLHLCDEQ